MHHTTTGDQPDVGVQVTVGGQVNVGDQTATRYQAIAHRWRVVDIIVASVLGVAIGLLFVFWNGVGYGWFAALDAVTPGYGGLATGIWLIGGVVGGLIIRKPGAALYVEFLAALVSTAVGNQWGVATLASGLTQGLGAELVFLLFGYRRCGLIVGLLAGAAAGASAWVGELFLTPNWPKSADFLMTYLVTLSISGTVLAGWLGWFLVRALASTGVLARFAVGRSVSARI
ncbi:MAG: hypothetical protein B5766_07770 [Candidatus Lumbricidophila eiseniae]|uniref:Uncharacterized protein n=1 Tax=Candidatus Lumbricidiphila eiseniae TaxID=1969409 RepID=A0A2A6FQF7_9MICO|nr:MAG: hypothetical protein B5766_07770 [Candidatus Lumbricidophila eiseniae]